MCKDYRLYINISLCLYKIQNINKTYQSHILFNILNIDVKKK